MITVEIGGRDIEVPTNLKEVAYSSYLPFMKNYTKYTNCEDEYESIKYAIAGLREIVGDIPELVDDTYSTASRFQVVENLMNIMRANIVAYMPPDLDEKGYEFDYKGNLYKIPFIWNYDGKVSSDMPFSAYIEAMESLRIITYDDDGTIEFTAMCRLVGALVLIPKYANESDILEIRKTIDKEADYFQELPAKTVMDIDFFLRNTMNV